MDVRKKDAQFSIICFSNKASDIDNHTKPTKAIINVYLQKSKFSSFQLSLNFSINSFIAASQLKKMMAVVSGLLELL